jgi:trehalose 6-phosphate phosphatase
MILLMLDYDGTLASVVNDSARAFLDRDIETLLNRLALRSDIVMAIISGRSLADLKRRIKLNNICYVGCHGLEIEGPGWGFVHPDLPKVCPCIKRLEKRLHCSLYGITKKNIIENKKYALTVHYRGVSAKGRAIISAVVNREKERVRSALIVEEGRKIYEFKPAINWNKGRAVEKLLQKYRSDKPYPIYIGDDLTDESAFIFLRGKGMSILVENSERPQNTAAIIRMSSIKKIKYFLNALV